MAIRDILVRGFGGWSGSGIRQIPTFGFIAALLHRYDWGGGGVLGAFGMPVITYDLFLRIMAALNTATWLAAAEVHLFQNNIVVEPTTLLTDLVEADYDGYAAVAIGTVPTLYLGADNNYVAQYAHIAFQPTGSVVSNTVYGYWVEGTFGGAGAKLGWAARFPEPIFVNGIEDAIIVEPRFIFGQPTIS